MSREKSELERGFESLGRALTGVTGRLLGPKAIGRETLPPETAISPEADAAIEKVSEDLGRFLNAAGEALKEHPLDPAEAVKAARDHTADPVTPEEGWSPLAAGLVNLGGGLAKVAEGVLDVVAPRKPKNGEGGAEGAAGTETGDGASNEPADATDATTEPHDADPETADPETADPETAEELKNAP